IEHHAVLHTLENLERAGKIQLSFLPLDAKGNIDLGSLEELLKDQPRSRVSIMHANNEIGNINDIQKIGAICQEYDAIVRSATVQTICHYPIDLQAISVAAISGSAHKFHGPKGVGLIRSEEHTSELQSRENLVCRLLLEKKKRN